MANSQKIQPLGKRVLVKPDEAEEVTSGGLIVPPSVNEGRNPLSGIVKALGQGKDKSGKEFVFDFKVGDRVFFKKYHPDEVEVEGEVLFFVEMEDILAVVN